MSAVTRLAPLARVGGRLFRGRGALAAAGGGVRQIAWVYELEHNTCLKHPHFNAEVACQEYMLFFFLNGYHQGHFTYPDPSQWTDEELGILPDEED
ncbi:PREDICTED: NADH dehydrogenase [ubiquinone] 1 beta subcomplex subunit 2, mitochondrial [Dipodomys ordii]|uniref:NADH dehydrogenase [ubiquinone] 1 beta subcomplex subunit 2, mitochondrial n=1 Tax=Dipodomys ordii TaxID=10020 RepID=A0A1S3FKE9_DIPOR|nr:PREDICTED: NADH dehydrogenase [ubiquinone] 1 beta subcomplex subunit 2, mitochondrial [Dipodomys ordii]